MSDTSRHQGLCQPDSRPVSKVILIQSGSTLADASVHPNQLTALPSGMTAIELLRQQKKGIHPISLSQLMESELIKI
jgi:hypothetical protein